MQPESPKMNPLMTDYPLKTDPKPVIVALDFAGEQDTLAFVRRLDPALCRLKVGKELFTATGRALVEKLVNQGFDVFLDLKYHDIPNTVAQACKVAAQMGVWLVDMHAGGGRRMMEAAANAVANFSRRPQLLGVTVLTSMTEEDLRELGFDLSAPQDFLLVTPGIRLDTAANQDDQRRIMTPEQALAAGSSYLVMGRPVTQAADPVAVLRAVNESARRLNSGEAQ